MTNTFSQHEVTDNFGSTVVESGTATTTPANVPSVSGNVISGFLIENTDSSNDLQISMDGGTTYKTVGKRANFSWNVKGDITQLVVKTLSSTATYEIVLNLEEN